MLSEKLSFSRSPGAKILQGCVVAIDSGGCCRPYAPSRGLSLPPPFLPFLCYEHLSRCLLSSASPSPYLSLIPLNVISSHLSRYFSFARSNLFSESEIRSPGRLSSILKGLKLPAQFPDRFRARSNY